MSLVLTIIKHPAQVSVQSDSHTFYSSGSIGRNPSNDWILQDPECFVSSVHAKVTRQGDAFFLNDTSTNGTFLNGHHEPVDRYTDIRLNEGDQLEIGDYLIQVKLIPADDFDDQSVSQTIPADPLSAANTDIDIFADSARLPVTDQSLETVKTPDAWGTLGHATGANERFAGLSDSSSSDPLGEPVTEPPSGTMGWGDASQDDLDSLLNINVATDPLAIDTANDGWSTPDWESSACNIPMPPVQDAFQPPPSQLQAPIIPDNWDEPDSPSPSQAAVTGSSRQADTASMQHSVRPTDHNAQLQQELAALKAENARLKQQLAQSSTESVTHHPMLKQLLNAMELPIDSIPPARVDEMVDCVGQMVRLTTERMMRLLSSRSTIKNEFRMNVTTIQPMENNPLKFSANVDDAFTNMFVRRNQAYQDALNAVNEGFQDIADHQVAIIAGIRSAFDEFMKAFNAEVLQQRFDVGRGSLLTNKKARYWDLYVDYYQNLMGDMDDSFHNLFGRHFVLAYEDQLNKIALSRRKD